MPDAASDPADRGPRRGLRSERDRRLACARPAARFRLAGKGASSPAPTPTSRSSTSPARRSHRPTTCSIGIRTAHSWDGCSAAVWCRPTSAARRLPRRCRSPARLPVASCARTWKDRSGSSDGHSSALGGRHDGKGGVMELDDVLAPCTKGGAALPFRGHREAGDVRGPGAQARRRPSDRRRRPPLRLRLDLRVPDDLRDGVVDADRPGGFRACRLRVDRGRRHARQSQVPRDVLQPDASHASAASRTTTVVDGLVDGMPRRRRPTSACRAG